MCKQYVHALIHSLIHKKHNRTVTLSATGVGVGVLAARLERVDVVPPKFPIYVGNRTFSDSGGGGGGGGRGGGGGGGGAREAEAATAGIVAGETAGEVVGAEARDGPAFTGLSNCSHTHTFSALFSPGTCIL